MSKKQISRRKFLKQVAMFSASGSLAFAVGSPPKTEEAFPSIQVDAVTETPFSPYFIADMPPFERRKYE